MKTLDNATITFQKVDNGMIVVITFDVYDERKIVHRRFFDNDYDMWRWIEEDAQE